MKAFVTGATGLVGNNLVRLLVQQGHDVTALVRSKEKAQQLLGDLNVKLVTGDMDNVAGFAPELAGCEVLFHTAAYFREYYGQGDHWTQLEKINIQGTLKLLAQAQEQGIKKVIYISSSGVIGPNPSGALSDETTPPGSLSYSNLYFKSKVLAEEAIVEFRRQHTLPIVQVLPAAIVGPGDAGPTGIGELIQNFMSRKIPAIPPGILHFVDARDVAQAMINGVERGKSGERYIVSGEQATMAEVFTLLEKVSGVTAPKAKMPVPFALAFAWFSETGAKITGGKPVATLEAIRVLQMRWKMSAAKAERELGVSFRPLEESFRDSVNWYRAHQDGKELVTV